MTSRHPKKVLTVFGTRPEAIKLGPVVKALERQAPRLQSVVCVTSQHREMLDQVLPLFDIEPDYDLNVMKPGQSLSHVTTEVLKGVEEVLSVERPDLILVQGDTTTTFAASLAGFYQQIGVGHVEAGLRTFDNRQPFPEEMNRRLTSALVDHHFAPTRRGLENLVREGIAREKIIVTGNTGIDALFLTLTRVRERPQASCLKRLLPDLDRYQVLLVTAHRRENFGPMFDEICKALIEIVERYPRVVVVYPMHLNPNVQGPANRLLSGYPRIRLIGPLQYAPFVELLAKAHIILTDSGGIQEEAPSLGKPVLVLRNVTERPEAVEAGTARVVGTNAGTIVGEVQRLLDNPAEYATMSAVRNPFGDGRASDRIAEYLLSVLS